MGLFGSKLDLAGRHVFITGASQGLGLEIARLCVEKNASVTLVGRYQAKLDRVVGQLQALAGRQRVPVGVNAIVADVTINEQVD